MKTYFTQANKANKANKQKCLFEKLTKEVETPKRIKSEIQFQQSDENNVVCSHKLCRLWTLVKKICTGNY